MAEKSNPHQGRPGAEPVLVLQAARHQERSGHEGSRPFYLADILWLMCKLKILHSKVGAFAMPLEGSFDDSVTAP